MNTCIQDKSIELNDETTKVIVNANGDRTGLTEKMCSLLDLITYGKATSDFTKKIKNAVEEAKTKKK